MKQNWAYLIIIVLALVANTSGLSADFATIHGTVYDFSLEKAENAVISLNTTPQQQLVSKDGDYSFDVAFGRYMIDASLYEEMDLIATTSENVLVNKKGTFRLDIILFPHIEHIILDDIDFEEDENHHPPKLIESISFGIIILAIVAIAIITIWFIRKKSGSAKTRSLSSEPLYDIDQQILNFIKKNKYTTQKEIRKSFPYSEAKISMVLSDLESKNKIEKIKKGRGNIIKIAP